MKVLGALILLTTTAAVFGQTGYEYVDDALLQRVAQIVYEYDQKVLASRSAGGSNNNEYGSMNMGMEVGRSGYSGGYQHSQPQQRVARAPNFNNYQGNSGSYGYAASKPQENRNQRKMNFQQRSVQQPSHQMMMMRSQRESVAAQAPSSRSYQQPEMMAQQPTKSAGGFGYILSQPEPVARVAEFHFTDSEDSFRSKTSNNHNSNNKYNNNNNHNNDGFRLA